MATVKDLIALRKEYQSKTIDFGTFQTRLAATLADIINKTDAEKANAYDMIATNVANSLNPYDEYDNGGRKPMLWYDSDHKDYIWEAVMQAIVGPEFFDFFNNLYEG